jgi:autotransporter-associated beta strand protein
MACWGTRLALVGLLLALAVRAAHAEPASNWVSYDFTGKLQYKTDATGAKLLDYSSAGYQGGTQNIPLVPVVLTLSPLGAGQDDTQQIKNAIAQVAAMSTVNGFKGTIQFNPGQFNISSQISIGTSGIVLRGAGQGTTGTTFYSTATTSYDMIRFAGSSSYSSISGSTSTIATPYVPVGATSFSVAAADISKYHVGDKIIVRRTSTQNWIDDIGMGVADLGTEAWTAGSTGNISMDRTITGISGNTITLNAGMTTAIDSTTHDGVANAYGGGTIFRRNYNPITNVGIEGIRFDTVFANATDMNHVGRPVTFSGVQNGWMRDTTTLHYYNGESVSGGTENVTLSDNLFRDPIGDTHSGGHALVGQYTLFTGNTTYGAHAPFVTQDSATVGPDAFVFGSAIDSHQSIGPHQKWASGVLWDNMKVTGNAGIEFINRGTFGTGHGWGGANFVSWNSQAPWSDVEMPPTAQNWAIGTITPNRRTNYDPTEGVYDSFGKPVSIGSLYVAQLKERLGPQALPTAMHQFSVGPNTNFTGPSTLPFVDPAWKAIVQSGDLVPAQGGDPSLGGATATVVGFDNAAANARRAATIAYSLTPGEKVVAATLTMTLKAVANLTASDSFFLNSPGMEFDYDMMGQLPWSAGETRTLSLDLSDIWGPLLGPLQNDALNAGKLNLSWIGNMNVDFAQLNLGTTGLGAANATRIWNGASAADGNALTAANWTTGIAPKVGDTLQFAGNTQLTVNNDLTAGTILGGITFTPDAGAFTLNGNAITLSGNITDSSTATQTINFSIRPDAFRTITVTSAAGMLNMAGVITGSNGIIKAGNGTLVLSASNTFTGGLIINGGTVKLANAGALNPANPMSVLFGPASAISSLLQLNGNNLTITNLNTAGSAIAAGIENGTSTPTLLTLNSTADNVFNGTLRDGPPTAVFAPLSLTFTGGGTLTLGGTNAYSGVTRILGSTITAGATSSFAGLPGTVRFGNITIDGTTFGGTYHVTDPGGNHLVVAGFATGSASKFTTSGQSGATGTFNVDAGTTLQVGALDTSGLPTLAVPGLQTAGTGPDGSTAGGSFIKTGPGTLRIVSQNAQQDTAFQLRAGTVDLWHARGLGGNDSTAVQLNMSDSTTLMLTQDTPTNFLTNFRSNDAGGSINVSINRLTPGAGVTHSFGPLQSSAGAFTMHVGPGSNITSGGAGFTLPSAVLGGNATFDVFNSAQATTTMTIPGSVSGIGFSLTKTGAGKLVLGGANSYTGTVINGGVLAVNGLITGATTVNSTGTLSGSGVANGAITINAGGAIAPGNSPGTLLVASAVFNPGSFLNIELGGTVAGSQFDVLKVNGGLQLNGALNVSLINSFAPLFGQSFDILDWGSLTGRFSSITLPALSSGLAWNATKLYTTGLLSVVDTDRVPGDFDRNHAVSALDISSMLVALTDIPSFEAANGLSDADLLAIGDLNADGKFTNADLQSLLDLVANPIGIGSLVPVPEPSSIALLALGGILSIALRRSAKRA